MVFACGQCGGVVELALAGGLTGISFAFTHLYNLIRRRQHMIQTNQARYRAEKAAKLAIFGAAYGMSPDRMAELLKKNYDEHGVAFEMPCHSVRVWPVFLFLLGAVVITLAIIYRN